MLLRDTAGASCSQHHGMSYLLFISNDSVLDFGCFLFREFKIYIIQKIKFI